MFVTFEGVDGSGKSTQARLLAEGLRADGPWQSTVGADLVVLPYRAVIAHAVEVGHNARRA